jgi:hypothetical protein
MHVPTLSNRDTPLQIPNTRGSVKAGNFVMRRNTRQVTCDTISNLHYGCKRGIMGCAPYVL